MATTSMIKAKGLQVFANYLSSVPEGSLFKADNVNIDRDGIIEPRRGIKVFGDIPGIPKQLLTYKNRILAHYDNAIAYLSNTDPATHTVFQGKSDVTMTTGSDIVTLSFHGFTVDETFKFTIIDPVSGIINTIDTYYIVNIINENQFKISATLDGSPIVFDQDYSATIQYDYVFEEVVENLRIKAIEMNSSLYVTTKDGIKKISGLNPLYVTDAGGINALDVGLALDIGPGASLSGFFGPLDDTPSNNNVEVAYQIVWGTKDVNNVLVLGRPSSRSVITNTTGEYRNVKIDFPVPDRITEDYFFQIYRTATALIDGSGDEYKLVYEAPFKLNATTSVNGYEYNTSTNIITLVDQQPEDLRDSGVPLYTNEFSGEGIAQANNKPPIAKDIAVYKNITFYSNTRTVHRQELTFLGFDGIEVFNVSGSIVVALGEATLTTSGTHGISVGDKFALAGSDADGEYTAKTGTTGTTIVFDVTTPSITQVDGGATITKSHFIIANSDESLIRRYYPVGRPETWELACPSKAATADSKYFNLTTTGDKIPYTFWIDKSGTAIAPAITDRALIRVDISDAGIVTDSDVAAKIGEILEATNQFSISQTGADLTIITTDSGKVTDVLSGTVSGGFGGTFNGLAHIDGFGQDASLNFFTLSANLSPSVRIDETARSLISTINLDTNSPVEGFYLSTATASLPGAFYLESKEIMLQAFKVKANNQSFGRMFNPDITTYVVAENDEEGNALYFSKVQQPESVPLVNKLNVGPRDKQILRIIGLRDSLFILKEEGIYRLSGESSNNFQVALFDNSASIIAADSAAVLNNQIYCLTTQGVSTISETGVGVISRPIENLINQVTSPGFDNYTWVTFGMSYEADRSYFLFIGESEDQLYANRCYRFNTFTQTWTSWVKDATCGIVETTQNKLYLGPPDIAAVEVERKTLTSRDFADRQYNRQISTVQFSDIYVDNAQNMSRGDMLTQIQYVKVPEFNRLIKKLKLDPLLNVSAGILSLTTITEPNVTLNLKMTQLVSALNIADPSTVYVYSGSSNFETIQTEYNTIIDQLNNSTGVFFADYAESVGTSHYDLLITSVKKSNNTVKVLNNPPFILGPVVHYKAVVSDIVWAPISFGETALSKHVREGKFFIESNSVAGLTVGYASDISGNFELISFNLDGDGGWGDSIFDQVPWGGEGTSYPVRTLIPAQKQRCRYLKAQFKHSNAFYKYSILGISFTFEMMSDRAWN